jgi:hypothetical protein
MERLVIFFPLSLRGFLRGSRGNPYLCHCEPAKGGRGNLKLDCFVASLLAMTVGGCHCEASRKRSRGNLLFNGMYYNPAPKEIATPERFSVQARNDKSIDCFVASLLAMIERSQ